MAKSVIHVHNGHLCNSCSLSPASLFNAPSNRVTSLTISLSSRSLSNNPSPLKTKKKSKQEKKKWGITLQHNAVIIQTTKNPGGICAFCLQEKLENLLSSSLSLPPIFEPSANSSSSSHSFKSVHHSSTIKTSNLDDVNEYYKRRVPITFLLAKKKKKLMADNNNSNNNMVFKRSKSATMHGRPVQFLDNEEDFSSRKRNGFWSFLYSSKKMEKKSPKHGVSKEKGVVLEEDVGNMNSSQVTGSSSSSSSSLERKVSRSRSVGCGSRSFSGDFFGRISNGFGDCALRRVESQREGKPKANERASERHAMQKRVRCGGIFGGLIMNSSSSSCQWLSSSSGEDGNGRLYERTKGWAWAFTSPMRPFSKPLFLLLEMVRESRIMLLPIWLQFLLC